MHRVKACVDIYYMIRTMAIDIKEGIFERNGSFGSYRGETQGMQFQAKKYDYQITYTSSVDLKSYCSHVQKI